MNITFLPQATRSEANKFSLCPIVPMSVPRQHRRFPLASHEYKRDIDEIWGGNHYREKDELITF